jgi:hypothetical protein
MKEVKQEELFSDSFFDPIEADEKVPEPCEWCGKPTWMQDGTLIFIPKPGPRWQCHLCKECGKYAYQFLFDAAWRGRIDSRVAMA